MENKLRESGLMSLVQLILKGRGQIRAQNIMLSAPGSVEQPIHTDSQWDKRRNRNPAPHYLTVLIPLVDQDLQTGGTRLHPGTHRDDVFSHFLREELCVHLKNPRKLA